VADRVDTIKIAEDQWVVLEANKFALPGKMLTGTVAAVLEFKLRVASGDIPKLAKARRALLIAKLATRHTAPTASGGGGVAMVAALAVAVAAAAPVAMEEGGGAVPVGVDAVPELGGVGRRCTPSRRMKT